MRCRYLPACARQRSPRNSLTASRPPTEAPGVTEAHRQAERGGSSSDGDGRELLLEMTLDPGGPAAHQQPRNLPRGRTRARDDFPAGQSRMPMLRLWAQQWPTTARCPPATRFSVARSIRKAGPACAGGAIQQVPRF